MWTIQLCESPSFCLASSACAVWAALCFSRLLATKHLPESLRLLQRVSGRLLR